MPSFDVVVATGRSASAPSRAETVPGGGAGESAAWASALSAGRGGAAFPSVGASLTPADASRMGLILGGPGTGSTGSAWTLAAGGSGAVVTGPTVVPGSVVVPDSAVVPGSPVAPGAAVVPGSAVMAGSAVIEGLAMAAGTAGLVGRVGRGGAAVGCSLADGLAVAPVAGGGGGEAIGTGAVGAKPGEIGSSDRWRIDVSDEITGAGGADATSSETCCTAAVGEVFRALSGGSPSAALTSAAC
jgi:hypothetical protein